MALRLRGARPVPTPHPTKGGGMGEGELDVFVIGAGPRAGAREPPPPAGASAGGRGTPPSSTASPRQCAAMPQRARMEVRPARPRRASAARGRCPLTRSAPFRGGRSVRLACRTDVVPIPQVLIRLLLERRRGRPASKGSAPLGASSLVPARRVRPTGDERGRDASRGARHRRLRQAMLCGPAPRPRQVLRHQEPLRRRDGPGRLHLSIHVGTCGTYGGLAPIEGGRWERRRSAVSAPCPWRAGLFPAGNLTRSLPI